jgi:hypothetical protein
MTKFKSNLESRDQKYGYMGVSFFGDDKEDLVEVLNQAQLPYSSFNHFLRTAVNLLLAKHDIDFQITER